MSYTITLWCGCRVYVACEEGTRVARMRVIERRGDTCPDSRHTKAVRLRLWEILPEPLVSRLPDAWERP
jgi:hypothetical protein